jgi:ATP-dependent Clp protease ATP-binding subunit ClpC
MNWLKSAWERYSKFLAEKKARLPGPAADSFSNFTPRAQNVIELARSEAHRLKRDFCGTEHLVFGIIQLGQGVAFNVLTKHEKLNLQTLRLEIESAVGIGNEEISDSRILFTARMKRVVQNAAKEAKSLNHTYIGTEHLLLGLLHENDGLVACIMQKFNIEIDSIRQEVLRELDPNFSFGNNHPEGSV